MTTTTCCCFEFTKIPEKPRKGKLAVPVKRTTSICKGPIVGSHPVNNFADLQNEEDELIGVVVTLSMGTSFDDVFTKVIPCTLIGERTSFYSVAMTDVDILFDQLIRLSFCDNMCMELEKFSRACHSSSSGYDEKLDERSRLSSETTNCGSSEVREDWTARELSAAEQASWRDLTDDLINVEPDSVIINWECCSACGDKHFPKPTNGGPAFLSSPAGTATIAIQVMALALRRGHTVVCSDFSLKSLLHEWSEEFLGPNPFKRLGRCDNEFRLEFSPMELQNDDVPFQLQVVGALCIGTGQAVLKAMPDTILFTVDPSRKRTDVYSLKVLTVATDWGGKLEATTIEDSMMLQIDRGNGTLATGVAGHVALTYSVGGGQLIASMGHWIELTRIDTSIETVLQVTEAQCGSEEALSTRRSYEQSTNDTERYKTVQSSAKLVIERSLPTRMKGARSKVTRAHSSKFRM